MWHLTLLVALAPAACTPRPEVPAPLGPVPTRAAQDAPAQVQPAFDHEHAAWTAVLRQHVRGDRFDYAALARDRKALDGYLDALGKVTREQYQGWERAQRYSFWINAYNAWTVRRVVDGWPVKSIRDLGDEKLSVWDRELVPLAHLVPELERKLLTLNDVEHKILRPTFLDPRVHAAVNCASLGCPPLRAEAFTATGLEAQLDQQVRGWLADRTRNRFDRQAGEVELSQVFEWFAADFARVGGALNWIARFRADDAPWLTGPKLPAVSYLEYDWTINAPRAP
jgi:hypothetical protein